MASHLDQENQLPPTQAASTRFGLRKDGQPKLGLSIVNSNAANTKKASQLQGKKAPAFTVFDENATDHTDKANKGQNCWNPIPSVNLKQQPFAETKQGFSVYCDGASSKPTRHALAPISQSLEDSACSFVSMNTSLHQLDYVLQHKEESSKEAFKIQDHLSPMVIDELAIEDNKPCATLTELNRHLESALPEVYLKDIYTYLRNCEERHRPKPHYMRKQSDITPGMRAILIDWLVEVAEEYKIHNETLFLAVSFIDRFLSHMSVLRGKLQLVGTAAMFIASKYEEIYPPEVGEFVYITDDTYTKKQVLRMEHLILKVLAFELAVPTSNYFLQRYIQLSRSSETCLHLASYLCELTLMETEPYLHHLPSVVAASCVALARLACGNEVWPTHVHASTGYSLEQLVSCIKDLHTSWSQAPTNPQQAIREKYKAEKRHVVSLITPPPISTLELAQF
ncbi:G2/mitotic-specific cyclin-A-like isoform X1 [Daphnia carinata]|uniref:G2/mitotic-specific cyclin-A-like isoform X1 n=1 Tax=Daphnia carinata TaxID=120202 RepID=UPI00257D0967|nr:G2/mitotic-specific cyclin-A-like isoform X1 [Daphnia carinata]